MLEPVAVTPAVDELLGDGVETDPGVLIEEHVDVVEGEGPHVRRLQRIERGQTRRLGGGTGAGEVGVEGEGHEITFDPQVHRRASRAGVVGLRRALLVVSHDEDFLGRIGLTRRWSIEDGVLVDRVV